MNIGFLAYQAIIGPYPFVFHLLFQESGEITVLQNLIEMIRFSEDRFQGIDHSLYVSLRMTSNRILGVLFLAEKWSIVIFFNVYFTCTVLCFTALYCVLLQLFHSIQRTCLDLSKAIVLYQKRICCKYGLSMILSKQ